MARPLAVDDVIQVTYWCRLFQQVIMSVLHIRVDTAPTSGGTSAEAQLQTLCDGKLAVRAEMPLLDAMIEAAGTNFAFDYVTAQLVRPIRSVYAKSFISVFGEYPALCTTANVAASISKQSLKVGRTGIGRLQFGGVPGEALVNGLIDSDYRAVQLTDIADEMYGGLPSVMGLGGSFRWCLPAGGVDHEYDVYNAFPEATVRTMHRRTVGLGI